LAASNEEERQMKEYQMRELKKSWAEVSSERKDAKKQPRGPDFDPENCGASSLQKFTGEDPLRIERKKTTKRSNEKMDSRTNC